MLKNKKAFLVLLVWVSLLFTSCSPAEQAGQTHTVTPQEQVTYHKYSHSFFGTFDTIITIMGYAKEEAAFDKTAQEAEELFERYHQLYDGYNAYAGINNLYYLNLEAKIAPVKVEKELYQLLSFCKEQQPKMQGRVNIALGNVLKIWHDARTLSLNDESKAFLPSKDTLQKAALHTDFDKLMLDEKEQTVYYLDPQLQLDLGAVAKGYAVQQVADALLKKGELEHFLINAGGNVYAAKPPLDGRSNWGVAIQDPSYPEEGKASGLPQLILQLHDLSVVTSGNYQRYYTVNGKRYHHLIDPNTLFPSDYMRSVTVVAKDSGLADLLSTALFLMPPDEGLTFLEQFPGVDALWILNDLSIQVSPGIQNYLVNAQTILNGQTK